MPHQTHHGLGRVELLGHERLGARRRGWSLSTAPGPGAAPGGAVLTAAAAVAVLIPVVRVGAGAVAASSVPAAAIPVRGGGGGRAVPVPAVPSTAVPAVSAVVAAASAVLGAAASAHGAHPPVTLVLVHQVGIVRIGVATETGPATSSSSTSGVNQLQQFRIDGLSGLLQHPDQLSGLPEVPRGEEGVGGAFVCAAGRTADTMDVVL